MKRIPGLSIPMKRIPRLSRPSILAALAAPLAPIALIALLVLPLCPPLSADPDIVGSVVKVYSQCYPYSYESPWLLAAEESGTGSGCIISGNRILTSAHIVANAKFIQVKRAGGLDKAQAEVEIIGHQCDLAILRVKDPGFFQGAVPLAPGPLVSLRDRVTVYGFPEGGEELSMTEGIVSRVELQRYVHSRMWLLCGQMDAAINPGSSGGPVVKDGQIVGIAFQAGGGQNISYMVPAPVIRHFLKDIEDGTFDGTPGLGVVCQKMENPDLRAQHGLGPGQSGILITAVLPDLPLEGVCLPGDVILSIDGHPVANDETVEFRKNERTLFDYYVQEHFIGDFLDLQVLRAGQVHKLRVQLNSGRDAVYLVPPSEYDRQPSHFIVGGLVFQRLTENYLRGTDAGDAPRSNLANYLYFGFPTKGRRAIVVLTGVLPDELNVGYESLIKNTIIVKANGRSVTTLQDIVDAVETNTGAYHVFGDEMGNQIVLDRVKTEERSAGILQRYMVSSDRSPDLKSSKPPAPPKK